MGSQLGCIIVMRECVQDCYVVCKHVVCECVVRGAWCWSIWCTSVWQGGVEGTSFYCLTTHPVVLVFLHLLTSRELKRIDGLSRSGYHVLCKILSALNVNCAPPKP